jgi:hypothetical protein
MRHRLPRGCAVVDADVVALRMELSIQTELRAIEQSQHRLALLAGDIEERTDVALRDNERMSGGDGESVPDDYGKLVRENDAFCAEGAEMADADHVAFYSLSPISGNATKRTRLGPVRVHQLIRYKCLKR